MKTRELSPVQRSQFKRRRLYWSCRFIWQDLTTISEISQDNGETYQKATLALRWWLIKQDLKFIWK